MSCRCIRTIRTAWDRGHLGNFPSSRSTSNTSPRPDAAMAHWKLLRRRNRDGQCTFTPSSPPSTLLNNHFFASENPPVPQHQQSLGQHHPNNQQLQNNTASNQQLPSQQSQQQVGPHEGFKPTNNNNASVIASSNKENAKPTEIIIKKPRTCNLLDVGLSFRSELFGMFRFELFPGLQAKLEGGEQSLPALLGRKAS